MQNKILVIDDEKDMLALLQRILSEKSPHSVIVCDDSRKIEILMDQHAPDLVITDLKMPHMDGIKVLEVVRGRYEHIPVILMTAFATIESAIEATRKGAFDYVTKPFRKERLLHVVDQAIRWRELNRENLMLREKLEERAFPSLIGTSRAMSELQAQIRKVAVTSATILITGESGTGKELVAKAIHSSSQRKNKPLVTVNCTTIPEAIIESELFGHVRGAFTGAVRDKRGLVEEADGGTLFLDEIGDLGLPLQAKLLRLLQEGEFRPVGSNASHHVDIRFIAATNRRLKERISRNEFREDLYYRLNVINLQLPPLRERLEDVPALAEHFLRKYSSLYGKEMKRIEPGTLESLRCRDWPGNVRELENTIERGVVMAADDTLKPEDISRLECGVAPKPGLPIPDLYELPFKDAKDRLVEEFEARYIALALEKNSGNVSQAARELGVKRQYLHKLMREKSIESKSFRKSDRPE